MQSMAFERRPDSSISIFHHGRQYRREPGSCGRWLKRTVSGWKAVSDHRARRLERAYRHSDTTKAVRRYPRLRPEDLATEAKATRLASLDKEAFHWIERGHKANIRLGRVFNQIKEILKHGEWEPYFNEKFLPLGVKFRTAQEYMKMAREADAVTENANSAPFPPATDQQAQEINEATEKEKARVAAAREQSPETADKETTTTRKKRIRLYGIYKLPLHMTGRQKDATDALLQSKKWPRAERKIMDLLQLLQHRYGILTNSEQEDTDENN
jgi:hypothetical protein